MPDIPDLSQLTNQIFNDLLVKFKPLLYIILALIITYIIYKLIIFLIAWKQKIREKRTYENTEKILRILEGIENKLGKPLVKKEEKPAEKRKEVKKKKSK